MPNIYQLGDQQFQSTGDITKDIELIKQHFPNVDTSALQKGLGGGHDFGSEMAQGVSLPPEITSLKESAQQLDPTSKEYKKFMDAYVRERDDYFKLNSIDKPKTKAMPSTTLDDINTLKDSLINNALLLEKKNSGFGGEGIDTGPIISKIPSGISEFSNKFMGYGESSSDRAALRQLEKQLFNPKKKEISGTAASDMERFTDLLPLVPNESENDQAFFNKGMQLQKASQQKLLDILKTAEDAGYDVSRFGDLRNVSPDDAVNSLLETLTKNPRGSFAEEFPDTMNSFLAKKLGQGGSVVPAGGLSPEKQSRLEELRRKKAEGSLQ